MERTFVKSHGSLALEENIDLRFFASEYVAYFVHVLQKADISLDELKLSSAVELCALLDDAVGRLLRPANNINSWANSIFDECLECVFANTTGAPDKDGHEAWREGRGDTLIGRDGFR
jgi:hypothetical protein